jgi:putative transposase
VSLGDFRPRRLHTFNRMARILRGELPDGYFHLTGNAVHATQLFRDAEDFVAFLALLKQGLRRWMLRLHAYCLMTTHYHAVVDGPVERLSPAVQWFQSHYAREHNARFDRKGALFRSRFSSWVIHDEEHYEYTVAYVLDNPVRAGLVDRPDGWPWSGRTEHLFAPEPTAKLASYASGRTGRSRRPRAQPQGHHRPAAA